MRCSLHAEALAEYRQATLYYAERARRLGEAFTAEVEAAVSAIQVTPRTRAADERAVRRSLLKRFPYVIHYVIEKTPSSTDEEIVVYAIRHSRRDRSGWLHRLPSSSEDA